MCKLFKIAILLNLSIFLSSPLVAAEDDWIITNKGTGFSYDTENSVASRKGISKKGLISVSKSKNLMMQSYWQSGAYRATIQYNRKEIVNGYDLSDVSRIKSFRFDKNGSTVYIRTTKGPKAIVELYQNNKPVLSWPRLSLVSILSYRTNDLYLTLYNKQTLANEFWHYSRSPDDGLIADGTKIGEMNACALLGSKVVKTGIALEVYCDASNGSDVKFLDFSTGEIQNIMVTEKDEFLAYSWGKAAKEIIPVYSVAGSQNGRHFYHAFSGSLLKYLGEPMSYASDESGKQSWNQSYRTLTLSSLYKTTSHGVFASLANQAMVNTLEQQNGNLGISGKYNPDCGWASRIYSIDGYQPISFMINQAMISASLIKSCEMLGGQCDQALKKKIDDVAVCLVHENEQWFDQKSNLYRIPYGAPFRYDGIWAPWNWHMMWNTILNHVGEINNDETLVKRAQQIASAFAKSWKISGQGDAQVLWRYWPTQYYEGWEQDDEISISIPRQKAKVMAKQRYEDINHAGISLLGLSFSGYKFTSKQFKSISRTANNVMNSGNILARDMDGEGPISPRWMPGAGWHIFASEKMGELYSHKLPGGVSSDQHLAYALLFNPEAKFNLDLTVSHCIKSECTIQKKWHYQDVQTFLRQNPLLSIKRK